MHRHRATCEAPGCGRVWRENCADCLTDAADKHRAETGHPVHLSLTDENTSSWELLKMTRKANRVLYGLGKGPR